MASKRISLTIDEKLLKKLDIRAEELSTSRSGLICIYCSQALTADELAPEVKRTLQGLEEMMTKALEGKLTLQETEVGIENLGNEVEVIKSKSKIIN